MVLKGKSKIIESKYAKTQYLIIPSAITRDSQYPFKHGDQVEIIIDTHRKLLMIVNKPSSSDAKYNSADATMREDRKDAQKRRRK